ncbi:Zn-ribbon domain-containing OB-fold protein [Cupriavidus sp. 2TAF22]|uniref:Zn-ribbon domain-containing OB-fold protein n=1 Tax=unclassified Cupriavidus TaxID=2640874 RepID=UPI003F8D9CE6
MSTIPADRKISDPALNPGDEPYFEAAAKGELLVKACDSCGRVHHYPRAICPFCWSADVRWSQSTGKGHIYTYSVTRRGAGAPYCIAYVTLDDGPTLMTNIVDTDLDTVKIGQRVSVVFKLSESGISVPMFAPAPR